MTREELVKTWEDRAVSLLKNRRIVDVYYMSEEQAEAYEWACRGLVVVMDDGTQVVVSADPEGNGPGALFVDTSEVNEILGPV